MNKNICVLDTEALDVVNKGVYDIGVTVVTPEGQLLTTKNWINANIFDNVDVFSSSYYQCKRPEYEYLLKNKKAVKMSWEQIQQEFNTLMNKYQVGIIAAYNAIFDVSAMSYTHSRHNLGKKFLERPFKVWDIMTMACRTILKSEEYHRFAEEHGYVSEKGNYKTTAECAYRYITKDTEFIEHHTALEDTLIETQIMFKALEINSEVDRKVVENVWKLAQ